MPPELLAYRNGEFLQATSLAIPLDDFGFVWGATITERVRTYLGLPFCLAEHIQRFIASCHLCRVPMRLSEASITAVVLELIRHNRPITGGEIVVIMLATPGRGGSDPTVMFHTIPVEPHRFRDARTNGMRLVTPTIRHLPPDCIPRAAKMRSRMFWWIAEQEVQETDPGAHALLLDHRGIVTETASANVAIVRSGTVITPIRSTVLPGVSLHVVEELCTALGIPFLERDLGLEDLQGIDEAFLTNTAFGIAGVSRINSHTIPFPGPILERLHVSWNQMVGCEIWQ